MTIMYVSVLILLLLCIAPAYYSRMTSGYSDLIRKLEHGLELLDNELENIQAERDLYAEREDELRKEQTALVQAAHGLKAFSEGGGGSYDSVVEYLVQSGKLSQQDLKKAEDFKRDSKSPYEIEEVLVMLDLVSSYDIKNAKKKVGG